MPSPYRVLAGETQPDALSVNCTRPMLVRSSALRRVAGEGTGGLHRTQPPTYFSGLTGKPANTLSRPLGCVGAHSRRWIALGVVPCSCV